MFGVCPSIFVFLEMKTTQNKSKWCLLNTPFNQISLNKKKKKKQIKQGLRTVPNLTQPG
jgi:hypothetical protein